MTMEEMQKEITFAEMVIKAIDNVKTPVLSYDEEKEVVRKALSRYIDDLESDMRGR